MCDAEFAESVDRGCPLVLGGALPHVMAAKAVAFTEALQPAFAAYAHAVVENAAYLAEELTSIIRKAALERSVASRIAAEKPS